MVFRREIPWFTIKWSPCVEVTKRYVFIVNGCILKVIIVFFINRLTLHIWDLCGGKTVF